MRKDGPRGCGVVLDFQEYRPQADAPLSIGVRILTPQGPRGCQRSALRGQMLTDLPPTRKIRHPRSGIRRVFDSSLNFVSENERVTRVVRGRRSAVLGRRLLCQVTPHCPTGPGLDLTEGLGRCTHAEGQRYPRTVILEVPCASSNEQARLCRTTTTASPRSTVWKCPRHGPCADRNSTSCCTPRGRRAWPLS